MDKLTIDGVKRIAINDDSDRVIEFNPSDILFAERFYHIYQEFEQKQDEYLKRSEELDAQGNDLDEHGMPANTGERLEFMKEVCGFVRGKIDHLFGEGASQKAFGDALSMDMIAQFFEGITPYVEKARTNKITKYTSSQDRKVMK